MLLSILGLVIVHYQQTGTISFDYMVLLKTVMSPNVEMVLMLGFFIAFAVKTPMVPLHTWLPDAHSQAPTAGSVDLAGILLKTAAYGIDRKSVVSGKSVSVRVDLGGRRLIKKKKPQQ